MKELIVSFISAVLSILIMCTGIPLIAFVIAVIFCPHKAQETEHFSNTLQICFLALVSLVVDALSLIVVPIALLFCKKEDEHLPKWAALWDESEYGINGDPYWRGEEHANGNERTYVYRLAWLWRNKSVHFSTKYIGAEMGDRRENNVMGDIETSDQPQGKSGYLFVEALSDGTTEWYPCYYVVLQIFNLPLCLRLYAGWKVKDLIRRNFKAPFVFSFSPVKKFVK